MASANISATLTVKVVTHEDGESHRVEVGGTPATAWLTDAGVIVLRDALNERFPVVGWEPVEVGTKVMCACAECAKEEESHRNEFYIREVEGRMGVYPPGVHLPDDIRLCRKV